MFKNTFKTLAVIFSFVIALMISTDRVKAEPLIRTDWDTFSYFITDLSFSGTNLHITGYAVDKEAQNYYEGNHGYYLAIRDPNTGEEIKYNLESRAQSMQLKINGITTPCGDTQTWTGYCVRTAQHIGFEGNLDISQALEKFRLSNSKTYEIWIGINEYWTGRDVRSRIRTFPQLILGDNTSYYKNTKFDLNKTKYSRTWRQTYTGVRARRYGPANGYWSVYDFGMSKPSGGGDVLYICTESVCGAGTATFEYAGMGYDSDGIVWLAGLASPNEAIDYTYSKNKTLRAGGSTVFWSMSGYLAIEGEFVYLTKEKADSADINYIKTYSSKSGTNATVTASYYNNPQNTGSPVSYTLKVGGVVVASGTNDTRTGEVIVSANVPATNNDRTVEFTITETWTNLSNSMTSTLYATENRNLSFTNESGTYHSAKPIMVHSTYSGHTKYYEHITYSNPQNYVLTDGDFSGSSLRRQTSLTYSVDSGATNGNIQKYGVSATNTISSPKATSNATISQNGANNLSTDNTIYVKYTDLNTKTVKTTYTGVGVNNYTITLQSNYKFNNLSSISAIDSYTTEKTENCNVKTTINNANNRQLKWYIYNDGNLIKNGNDTWNGNKDFKLDNYIINKNGNITVKIIQPNGVITQLTGKTYIAEETNVTLTEGQIYTPKTPVRVTTTPTKVTEYFENISINSINTDLNLDAGEGFENKIKINYETQSGDIKLNNNEITVVTTLPEQDGNLNYTETVEGVLVPLESTSSNDSQNIFELPVVMVEKSEGTLYRQGDAASAGLTLLNGGRRWYTKMTAEEGTYDFYNTLTHVGVNAINIKFYNTYNINGSLLGNTDSSFKVIRVQNPSNPNFTYHKTYKLEELLEKIESQKVELK